MLFKKNFEVIGEAAYHITIELKDKYDNIEWSKIQGLRHVLVHDYYKNKPRDIVEYERSTSLRFAS